MHGRTPDTCAMQQDNSDDLQAIEVCDAIVKRGGRLASAGILQKMEDESKGTMLDKGTIRFILLQNRQGKTRLAKYYVPLEDSEKHKVEYEVHRLVVNRDAKFTNFVEFRTHKVIYRRYAGLFFSLCVDITDNELAYLECIHLFVEILDHFFSNVCELDLVFNFHKVLHG
ncbi:hypothetical protein D5086_004200 [Populus alba]|uniref:Uncharacterized protein n=1 Tax=Populus alba TaxID=43335 RepID=A0ACC4CQX3_POPAL